MTRERVVGGQTGSGGQGTGDVPVVRMAIFGVISLWSFGTFESRAELLFLGASGGGPVRV